MTQNPRPASAHERQLRRIAVWTAAFQRLDGGAAGAPGIEPAPGGGVLTDAGDGRPVQLQSKQEALQALLAEAAHADARRPEWVRHDGAASWLVRPSEMRIVLRTDPGTLAQIVYPSGPAAEGTERPIRCEHRGPAGTPMTPPPTADEPPAWTAHLTAGALLLRTCFRPAADIWKNLQNGTATEPAAPPPADTGYDGLAALYAGHQWLEGHWRRPPPKELLNRIGVRLDDEPRRASASGAKTWSFTAAAAVRSAAAGEAQAGLCLRRAGWTLPFDAPGAPVPADQARIVVAGAELLCRIAMNGQLTDPQPPGVEHADWRGRWSEPAAEPAEHLRILGAEWAAGLVRLSDEHAVSADSQPHRPAGRASSTASH